MTLLLALLSAAAAAAVWRVLAASAAERAAEIDDHRTHATMRKKPKFPIAALYRGVCHGVACSVRSFSSSCTSNSLVCLILWCRHFNRNQLSPLWLCAGRQYDTMRGAGCLLVYTSQMFLFFLASLSCLVGVCSSSSQRRLQVESQIAEIAPVQYDGISKKGDEVLKKEWKVENPEATIQFTKEGKFVLCSLYMRTSWLYVTSCVFA